MSSSTTTPESKIGGKMKKEGMKKEGKRRREKKLVAAENRPNEMASDSRFQHISTDKRFKPIPKLKRTIKIDERFEGMFKDKSFKTSFLTHDEEDGTNIELKRLYHTEEDELKLQKQKEDEEENSDDEGKSKSKSKSNANGNDARFAVDYSRGEVLMESSDEEEEADQDNVDSVDTWRGGDSELHESVPIAEELTSRLAVLNVDWSKISADDLFVLANSFKPAAGIIKSVTIYPSDFGMERMELEAREGPAQFVSTGDEELSPEEMQGRLRAYEMDKLRYFYAVIECDTTDTASVIYDACDGLELEKSQNMLDMRYIPAEEKFENEPKDVASEVPNVLDYKLDTLGQATLAHSKVKMTWEDDQDDERMVLKKRKFNQGELEQMDYSNYMASDDESDFSEDDELVEGGRGNKLKALSALCADEDSSEDEEDEKPEGNMEVTFKVGMKEKAESLLKARQDAIDERRMTVGEKLEKKKAEKKKARKDRIKLLKGGGKSTNGDDSDENNELREGMDDPYFQQNLLEDDDSEAAFTSKHTTNSAANDGSDDDQDNDDHDQDDDDMDEGAEKPDSAEQLGLLTAADEDSNLHFDMNKLIKAHKNDQKKTKKRNKKGKKGAVVEEHKDTFELNTEDSRFSAVFKDKDYSIDPTQPEFKKTKQMDRLISERQKKQKSSTQSKQTTDAVGTTTNPKQGPSSQQLSDINDLVAKVKKNSTKRRSNKQH